jgi:hypothetical protein
MFDHFQRDELLLASAEEAWRMATPAQKEVALKEAQAALFQLYFKGIQGDGHQAEAWPRIGVYREDGSAIEGVPPEVEAALVILGGIYLITGTLPSSAVGQVYPMLRHLTID